MSDHSEKILAAVNQIRDLIQLMAEPQIAARDQKLRNELVRIVGKSVPKQKSVMFMDGSHNQVAIRQKTNIHKGYLSTLVKQLSASNLLTGDVKQPKLVISVPSNFFEKETDK